MTGKRFYDAARDCYVRDERDEPVRMKRRVSISYLCSVVHTCPACQEDVSASPDNLYCSHCSSVFCRPCVSLYTDAALRDRSLIPLRCAACRTPLPLPALRDVLPVQQLRLLQRLARDGHAMTSSMNTSAAFDARNIGERDVCGHTVPRLPSGNIAANNTSMEERTTGQHTTAATLQRDVDEADDALRQLMAMHGWKRCPQCGHCVERTTGCPHMVCRCGCEFCYNCGSRWVRGCFGCSVCSPENEVCPPQLLRGDRFDRLRDEVCRRLAMLVESLQQDICRLRERRLPITALCDPIVVDRGVHAPNNSIDFVLNSPHRINVSPGLEPNPNDQS